MIQQPRRLRDAQVLALDPTPGGQGVGHETFAPGPVRVFHVRKCPVQGLDGPFGEVLAGRGGQLVEEHGLDEAVDGVGPGLGVAAHEGVAGQRGEELVERMVAAGRGGEGRGERLAELGGPLQDQLVGDGVGGEEGAEAEQRDGRGRCRGDGVEAALPGRADGLGILARDGAHLVQQLQPQGAVGGEIDGERLLVLDHVGGGLLQRQRQVAQLTGEGPRRVLLGGVERPLAARALPEELQRLVGRQDRQPDRLADAQDVEVVRPRGEQDVAPGVGGQVGLDQGGVVGVVEDQQVARLAAEPAADGRGHLVAVAFVLLGQAQHLGQLAVAGGEAGLGVGADPEDGAVLVAVAVGILDGRLGLADAPQPGDRLRQRRGRAGGQGGFELREDRLAAREVGIPRVGDVPPRPPRRRPVGRRGG